MEKGPEKKNNTQNRYPSKRGRRFGPNQPNRSFPPSGRTTLRDKHITAHLLPTKKDRKKVKNIKAKNKNISIEAAYAKTSSLAPTRLALNVDLDRTMSVLSNMATIASYHIQSTCSSPIVDPETELSGWNPSLILAYFISITAGRLMTVGALNTSNQIQVMGHYSVPTFFAKWLQQISPSTHMGREVVPTCADDISAFLNWDCGTGGISNIATGNSGYCEAPVFAPVTGDSEGWWTCLGNATTITPGGVKAQLYSKISSIITKAFDHHVTVSEIPLKASNSELKCTPIADSEYGQFMYSCIDAETTCDLLLPMCALYTNNLVNSLNSTLIPTPVRVDGGLAIAPEAKLAFMFHLANKFPFRGKDSFVYYLRKYGLKDHLMANAVINIRQLNWASITAQVMIYCKTLIPDNSVESCWYLFNYCMTVLISNIPGAFRAISPVTRSWSIAPLYKETNNQPQYSAFGHTPKVPPFLANIIKALREPIRYENQISFYVSILPSSNSGFWWYTVFTNPNGTTFGTGGPYGQVPATMYSTPLIIGQVIRPYPGFSSAGSGYSDQMRNYITLFGNSSLNAYFQNKFTQPNGNLNLYNGWLAKATNFTKRHAKFYIPTILDGAVKINVGGATGMTTDAVVVKQIFSNEPTSHHAACLAIGHLFGYYSPSDFTVPFSGPVFAAQPVIGAETCVSGLMSAETPGQGSTQAIAIAKASNPAEATAHAGAEAINGIIPDSSEVPDPSIHKQICSKFAAKLDTGIGEVAKIGGDAVKDFVKEL